MTLLDALHTHKLLTSNARPRVRLTRMTGTLQHHVGLLARAAPACHAQLACLRQKPLAACHLFAPDFQ